jgi:hypothetical protein
MVREPIDCPTTEFRPRFAVIALVNTEIMTKGRVVVAGGRIELPTYGL